MRDRIYVCIDLKSFYASVECRERNLDPFTTNLVVADPERTEKTICLAVTPAMKALGVPGRCRVFEIPKGIKYIMAPPRMQLYIDYSAKIYGVYLKYISAEDIHVYSIDEVFMDVTDYLSMYNMTAKELGIRIMQDIFETTGVTATCGIGTNMYLAKVALDITAKHVPDHIGELDEQSFVDTLWKHTPLTDFWRLGKGMCDRLSKMGIYTMEDIAKTDEDILYRVFGVDAELMIDHAWGRETVSMKDIKNYKPKTNSISSGQVLGTDADYQTGMLLVKEMVDLMCLELVEKNLVTDSVTLHIGCKNVDKSPHGTCKMDTMTCSTKQITEKVVALYEKIMKHHYMLHRINISFNNLVDEAYRQYDLFSDPAELAKERKLQNAMIDLKNKFGKNAVLKGMNLEKGAKTIERNSQIGGHRSGKT